MTHLTVTDDQGFGPASGLKPGQSAEQRVLASHDDNTHVLIWKTEGGTFGSDGSAYGETFVVLSGEATITLEDQAPVALREGSVFHRPLGTPNVLDIPGPFRKLTMVVLAPQT